MSRSSVPILRRSRASSGSRGRSQLVRVERRLECTLDLGDPGRVASALGLRDQPEPPLPFEPERQEPLVDAGDDGLKGSMSPVR